jgi:hypothetical protein
MSELVRKFVSKPKMFYYGLTYKFQGIKTSYLKFGHNSLRSDHLKVKIIYY